MPAPSWRPTLVAALVAAFALAPQAQAGAACGEPGYSYAGLRTAVGVRGVRALVTALDPALIADGQVVAWVGVGRATVAGKRGAIRVGLLATNGEPNRLYYEILRPGGWRAFVGAYVEPGERHRIAVLELARRRGWWRVWIDGNPVGAALNLRGGGGRRAMATAETWRGSPGTCTPFQYRFAHISVLTPGRTWQPLKRSRRVLDSGFELVRPAPHTFLSSAGKKKAEPLPSPPLAPNAPSPPDATAFVGDWETGDWRQWSGVQYRTGGNLADQFEVVTDPRRNGNFAAKFTVHPGDKFQTSSGERSEVLWGGSDESEGDEYWYSWSTLFPSGWTEPAGWGLFLQWHSDFPISPPVCLNARGNYAEVVIDAGPLNPSKTAGTFRQRYRFLDPLPKGVWNDFIARIRWSLTDGAITIWHRTEGETVYTKRLELEDVPTLQSDGDIVSENYIKLGLYRGADTKTDFLYQDGFRRWQSETPPSGLAGTF